MTKLGKLWTGAVAYVSLGVGAGLSMAGNLADTYRTRGAATDTLDEVMAIGWPALVILAIEMFVSPRWSAKTMFQVWRWVGCLAVGGMAMIVSWTHLHGLMASRGQLDIVAILGPLAIDGMAIMATGLILSTRTRGHGQAAASGQDVAKLWTPDMANAANARWLDTDTGHPLDTPDLGDMDIPMATEPGQPWPEDMAKLASWTGGHERALDRLTAGVGDEVERDLRKMAEFPPLPRRRAPVVPGIPDEARELLRAWDPEQLKPGEVDALLAGWHGVSPRTARRWRDAVRGPSSAPPAA